MKKKYMKPETVVINLNVRPSLLAGSNVGDTPVRMKWDEDADAIDDEYGL